MVGQERQRAPLIWRDALEIGEDFGASRYYELVREGDSSFFAVQYAAIYKMAKNKWELRISRLTVHDEMLLDVTYYKTLTEAKAVGIVKVRFANATN